MDKEKNLQIDAGFEKFLNKVRGIFKVEKAILFGSRAKGTERLYSDYDLIIVSDSFNDIKWHKRIEQLVKFWELHRDIDILPYTKKEFDDKKKSRCIVKQALAEGIAV